RTMDAAHLDFPLETFDGVRADRMLQHVADPVQVLTEMIRVAKPGGVVAVSDTDWGTLAVDMSDRDVTRRLLGYGFDRGIRNPWIGRQLPRRFREAELLDIRVVPHALLLPPGGPPGRIPQMVDRVVQEGHVSREDATAWMREFEERYSDGANQAIIVMLTVAGRKA